MIQEIRERGQNEIMLGKDGNKNGMLLINGIKEAARNINNSINSI